MGQKVNPNSFRLLQNRAASSWRAKWFAGRKLFAKNLQEDLKIRDFLENRLETAGLVNLEIERFNKRLKLRLLVARPGVVIGRGGKGLEETKLNLLKEVLPKHQSKNIEIQVEEFKNADISAKIVCERIAYQLANRMPHRRVVSKAIERTMAAGAKGIRIVLSGRIGGAEIGRNEKYSKGSVPLSTIRANIDYFEKPSLTRSGYVGIKVYIAS